MAASRTGRGQEAEAVAAGHIESLGWQILGRNYRGQRGEIDLIALKDGVLAFLEVKRVDAYGPGSLERSVDRQKQRRIIETSKLYLARHREYTYTTIRYDVIAIQSGRVECWLESAFAE